MRHRRNRKPLGTMTLILTAGIFLIMLTVMTLQGFLMYLLFPAKPIPPKNLLRMP